MGIASRKASDVKDQCEDAAETVADSPWLEGLARWGLAVRGGMYLLIALLAHLLVVPTALVLWKRHLPRLAVFLLATTVGGGLLNTALKLAVNRPRPSVLDPVATAHGRSFPSGHAMSSTIVYGALLLVVLPWVTPARRRLAVAGAVVMVLVVGFSRLALGVHYLSDVVAGYVLGCAWLAASAATFGIWRVERAREGGT